MHTINYGEGWIIIEIDESVAPRSATLALHGTIHRKREAAERYTVPPSDGSGA